MQRQTDKEHTGTAELTIIHYDTELNRFLGDDMKQPFQKTHSHLKSQFFETHASLQRPNFKLSCRLNISAPWLLKVSADMKHDDTFGVPVQNSSGVCDRGQNMNENDKNDAPDGSHTFTTSLFN